MGGRPNASAGVALGKRLVLVSSEALHELAETDILRRSAWSSTRRVQHGLLSDRSLSNTAKRFTLTLT